MIQSVHPRRTTPIHRFVVLLAIAGIVAACGGTAATPSPVPPSVGPSAPVASADASPSSDAVSTEPSAELIAAAKAEGTLTWYTTVPPKPNASLAKAFTDKYGIDVVINRNTSPTLGPLLRTEVESNNIVADVIELGDTTTLRKFTDSGWFVKQDKMTLPILNTWPAEWAYGDSMYPQAIAVIGITYNKELVGDDIPDEWSALTDPKWRGKILMTDPRLQSGSLVGLLRLRAAYGDAFLQALSTQELQTSTSSVNSVNAVAAGDVALSYTGTHWITTDLIDKGAAIDDAFPSPSVGGSEQWVAQVKGSPHPNAAALFLNFALSQEGQVATCKDQCSSVTNAPGTMPFPSDYKSPEAVPADVKAEIISLIGLE